MSADTIEFHPPSRLSIYYSDTYSLPTNTIALANSDFTYCGSYVTEITNLSCLYCIGTDPCSPCSDVALNINFPTDYEIQVEIISLVGGSVDYSVAVFDLTFCLEDYEDTAPICGEPIGVYSSTTEVCDDTILYNNQDD